MSNEETIRVELGPRSYEVRVAKGLLTSAGQAFRDHGLAGPVAILVDAALVDRYIPMLEASLKTAGLESFRLPVPGGEGSKTPEMVARLHSALAQHRVPRSGTVVALGGGVLGDLGGYVAATYLRGLAFVQMPSTLLAMVDSSVGGKTGVNLPEGKNLVGAFHQPRLVLADLDTLATLPAREFAAGMAEVIKYGLIRDAALFDRVAAGVNAEASDLASIINRCIAIKARIVENDEFETQGERALLNFGHTIGHAIEKATAYKKYLHGEAIALGMRAAAWLSVQEKSAGLAATALSRIDEALRKNNLPLTLDTAVEPRAVLTALGNDKKIGVDGLNRWVLLTDLGVSQGNFSLANDLVQAAVACLYTPAP